MNVLFPLFLLATLPFLTIAKNPTTTANNRGDGRFLKKGAKASKTPKAATPKSFKSSAPTAVPSLTPTETPRVQAFYNDEATLLYANVNATSMNDDNDVLDSDTLVYNVDLGTVKNVFGKDTMAIVQTSFTTTIHFFWHNYGEEGDEATGDDAVDNEMDAKVTLQILAYAGCDSAVTCAGVTPTPLIPAAVEMFGWHQMTYIDYNDDIEGNNDDYSADIVDDEDHRDIFTSTNDSNFILVGKGTGDIFLQASITIDLETRAGMEDTTELEMVVNDWVVLVQHEETHMRVSKFHLHTLSPTTSG